MSSDGSITHWLDQLKAGEQAAAQPLFQAYFQQLVRLARQHLNGVSRRVADEEDVALSALDSFCRGAERGRYPDLADRHDLWRMLVRITTRKAHDLRKQEQTLKRGGTGRGEPGHLGLPHAATSDEGLEQLVGTEPTPAFAAEVAEECRRLLDRLDAGLRALALLKMESYTNEEIARQLGCALATVGRRLQLIRAIWETEGGR